MNTFLMLITQRRFKTSWMNSKRQSKADCPRGTPCRGFARFLEVETLRFRHPLRRVSTRSIELVPIDPCARVPRFFIGGRYKNSPTAMCPPNQFDCRAVPRLISFYGRTKRVLAKTRKFWLSKELKRLSFASKGNRTR